MWTDNDEEMDVGHFGFVIEIDPVGRETRTVIRGRPGRMVSSNERRLRGKLGATNNIVSTARGVAVIERLNQDGRRALVRVLRGDEQRAALEELGHPELDPNPTDTEAAGIEIDMDPPNGPVVAYTADAKDVDAAIPAGWAIDYSRLSVDFAAGTYRAPLVRLPAT